MNSNVQLVPTVEHQHAVLGISSLEVKEKEEDDENKMKLLILSPGASHYRRILEKTDFNIKKTLPLPGEHVLTVLENALVKIDLVSALPWLCSSLVEGNPQLEYILGPKCIRALVRLMTAQMAWREAKSGRKIPSGRSSSSSSPTILRFHVMDENLNDKSDEEGGGGEDEMKPSTEKRDKRDKNFVPTFGISTIKSQEEEEEEEKEEQPAAEKEENAIAGCSSSLMIKKGSSQENKDMMTIDDQKKKKKKKLKTNQNQNDEKMTVSKRRRRRIKRRPRRHDRTISILENDQSKITFLWNLIRNGSDVLPPPPPPPPHHQSGDGERAGKTLAAVNLKDSEENMTREQVDALRHKKEKKKDKGRKNKQHMEGHKGQNIVGLIRAALDSKYEDHVRKALKEKDSKALLCMLSLVGDTTNLLKRQLSSSSSSSSSSSPSPTKKDKTLKLHKPTCRKLARPKSRISPPPEEGIEKEEETTTTLLSLLKQDGQVSVVDTADQIENKSNPLFCSQDDVGQDDEKVAVALSSPSSSLLSEYGLTNLFSTSHSLVMSHMNESFLPRDLHLSQRTDSSRSESSSSQLHEEEEEEEEEEEKEEGEDNDRENENDQEEEEEANVTETAFRRTQQVLRIPYYYSRSKSNPSTSSSSSSYEDYDQIVHSIESMTIHEPKFELDKEQEDERQGEIDRNAPPKNDDNDDDAPTPIEEGRKGNGRDSQPESPNTLTNDEEDELMHSTSRPNSDENSERRKISSDDSKEYWEKEVRRAYKEACNLLSLNFLAVKKIMDIHKTLETPTCTPAFQSFRLLFTALQELMTDRLATSLEAHLTREHRLREYWTNERRCLAQLENLQAEFKDLEEFHGPQMLTLDFQTRILTRRLRQVSNDNYEGIRQVIRETELNSAIAEKGEMVKVEKVEKALMDREKNSLALKKRHNWEEIRFKNKRNDLELKLREEIAKYDEMAFKRQEKLDNVVEEKVVNEVLVNSIQEKFADVKDRFIDMRATKKLRQIKRNMELADDHKRARAAKMIQDFWRRYKIRKRRRERKKGRKGKKKAAGGGGGAKKSSSVSGTEAKMTGKVITGKQPSPAGTKSKTRA